MWADRQDLVNKILDANNVMFPKALVRTTQGRQ
jgi:hypothetical protein